MNPAPLAGQKSGKALPVLQESQERWGLQALPERTAATASTALRASAARRASRGNAAFKGREDSAELPALLAPRESEVSLETSPLNSKLSMMTLLLTVSQRLLTPKTLMY